MIFSRLERKVRKGLRVFSCPFRREVVRNRCSARQTGHVCGNIQRQRKPLRGDSELWALISSIVHSRSPVAKRVALLRSNASQNSCPSCRLLDGAELAGYSPMMKGIVRVRTTCLRNAVNAVVMFSPSSSKTMSLCRFRLSSMRNVVVMDFSCNAFSSLWRILYNVLLGSVNERFEGISTLFPYFHNSIISHSPGRAA